MEVNATGQNANNINANANANVSDYGETNTKAAVPQVQQIDTKSSTENETQNKEYSKKDLDSAIKKINSFLNDENTHAEYSYHKETQTVMIKIIDDDTKQVILEVPPKKILDMIASMMKQVGLLDKRA
ncbi:flagellar protein FlaG [Clostridium sp.]|uniref:flagellar protein FlaG n=1 Tax=Clostridium sp. TaxID=1506 RepID=UPI00284A32C9|nr:flagellar protein FlaG [Clostridium sp.]MDR3593979.1 flagellar protein FlaG [Clostridium sp.]